MTTPVGTRNEARKASSIDERGYVETARSRPVTITTFSPVVILDKVRQLKERVEDDSREQLLIVEQPESLEIIGMERLGDLAHEERLKAANYSILATAASSKLEEIVAQLTAWVAQIKRTSPSPTVDSNLQYISDELAEYRGDCDSFHKTIAEALTDIQEECKDEEQEEEHKE